MSLLTSTRTKLTFSENLCYMAQDNSKMIYTTTNLKNDGGLLLPRDLVVVALHQQRWRDVHLAHVHLDHDHDEDDDDDGDVDDDLDRDHEENYNNHENDGNDDMMTMMGYI